MSLDQIIWASFIIAVGLFSTLIGYYDKFSNTIKEKLKEEEDLEKKKMVQEISKEIFEKMSNTINSYSGNLSGQQIFEIYSTVFESQINYIERQFKRSSIILEPAVWLVQLREVICLAILLFLTAGILGLSSYNSYASLIFVIGIICFVYGIFKYYQITNRELHIWLIGKNERILYGKNKSNKRKLLYDRELLSIGNNAETIKEY